MQLKKLLSAILSFIIFMGGLIFGLHLSDRRARQLKIRLKNQQRTNDGLRKEVYKKSDKIIYWQRQSEKATKNKDNKHQNFKTETNK